MKSIVILSLRPILLAVFMIVGSRNAQAEESQATLKAQAKITQEEATKTALDKVPNGKVVSVELEKENGGKLVWSFDISMPNSTNITEIQVDAESGKIAASQVETPKDQAQEAAADEKAKNQ